jgi:ssDNA-binding Zn-finger/Zn-ribbon topoisomerase 1
VHWEADLILKEKEFTNSLNPRLRAGDEAEKQMAFYLNRAFRKRDDCFVINDLRVIYDGDVAQIDHLVVSVYGLFIVESKSVHGTISINKHGDWRRTYNDDVSGIPSPVLQATEQGRILKELLRENADKIRNKILFGKIQQGFRYCPVCVYVAISDSGIIDRGMDVPELFKADVVASAIAKKIDEYKSRASLLSPKNLLSSDVIWEMSGQEANSTAQFLVSHHTPIELTVKTEAFAADVSSRQILIKEHEKTFVPRVGALCPECGKQKLIRKSIKRNDGTETDFLACSGYPSTCKGLFPLVALSGIQRESVATTPVVGEKTQATLVYLEGCVCPRCKEGKLVKRKGKTEFLGCSNFPKCKFTDYRN